MAVKDREYQHDPPLSACLCVITEQKARSESKRIESLSKSYWNSSLFFFFILTKASWIKCLLLASIGNARFNPWFLKKK